MSLPKAIFIFLCAAVAAWFAAYAPEMWHKHKVLAALDEPVNRWVCIINGDAVSSQYEGYITKKYIMLGGQRFYSDQFKKWGNAADFMLVVIDDNMFMNWVRLDLDEAGDYARRYGIARAGCRRMTANDRATTQIMPVTPPVNRVYPGYYPGASESPPSSSSFDWKKAVGPALGNSGNTGESAPAGGGTEPAPSSGGVTTP